MKKVKKIIISSVLALSIFVTSVVPSFASIGSYLAIAEQVFSALSWIHECYRQGRDAAEAQQLLILQYPRISDINSRYATRVSADDLYSTAMSLVQAGMPCEVRTVTVGGLSNVNVIVITDEPRDSLSGRLLAPGWTFTGKYLAPSTSSSSDHPHLLYAIGDNSAYSLGFIRDSLNSVATTLTTIKSTLSTLSGNLVTLLGYVDNIEGYIDGVEGYLSAQSGKLSDIVTNTGKITSVLSSVNTIKSSVSGQSDKLSDIVTNTGKLSSIKSSTSDISSAVSGLPNKLISMNDSLSDIESTLSSIPSLLSSTQYLSHLSNSSGTQYSSVLLPYDLASALCADLNSRLVGQTVSLLDRNSNSVSSHPTFKYATVSGGYIRVRVNLVSGSDATVYLSTDSHVLYAVDDPTSINLSGNVSATLNDNRIVAALGTIRNAIEDLSISESGVVEQWCCAYTSSSDSTPYERVTIPYETAANIVAQLNVELMGKKINVFSQDTNDVISTPTFHSCYLSNGRIRVIRSGSSARPFLLTSNHILIEYSDPTYSSQLLSLVQSSENMQSLLEEHLENIEDALSNLNETVSLTLEEIQNLDLPQDNTFNDIWNVGTDNDGNPRNLADTTIDASRIIGKLLSFLYDLCFRDALSDDALGSLRDFYFDSGEGVDDIWAS